MKHQGISRGTAAAFCLLTAVGTFNVTLLGCRNAFNQALPSYQSQQKTYAKLGEIQELIDQKYIGEYDAQNMLDTAALGMVVGTGDRWSSYLNADAYKEYKLNQAGELVGIGISVFYDQQDGTLCVRDVYEGSPAENAGLQVGDIILAAEDKTMAEDGYQETVNAVRGKAGTKVRLSIQHGEDVNAVETVVVKRAKMNKNVIHAKMLEDQIGYIAMDDFDGGADTQFLTALEELKEKGAKAFVFDVRYNPGGLITVLTHILDPLLPEGNMVSLTDKAGKENQYVSDANALEMPMAVLVNRESISAAELFAAALQEYGVATVVGTQTIGKGYAQRTYPLSDGSAVVLSDQKYYTPKGKNLANIGIKPDVEVVLSEEKQKKFYALSEDQDDQLQAAIAAVSHS